MTHAERQHLPPRQAPRARPAGESADRRAVALITLLLLVVCLGHSILTPVFTGPDELRHVDLVFEVRNALGGGGGYPIESVSRVRPALEETYDVWYGTEPQLTLRADDAPPREQRPDFLGMPRDPDRMGSSNQLTQHPPLAYAVLGVGSGVSEVLLGTEDWPIDRVVMLLRFLSTLVLLPLPALLFSTVRRLGGSREAALTATILPLAVPQLTFVAGLVTNDSLLLTLGAVVVWLASGVSTGDRSTRTAVRMGVVTGLALLTKAFALALVPYVVAVYLFAGVRETTSVGVRERLRARLRPAAIAVAVAAAVGGWWWIRNLVVHGEIQPHFANLRPVPPGFEPMGGEWYLGFLARLVPRFWGQFGRLADGIHLPLPVVVAATVALVVACVAGTGRSLPKVARRANLTHLALVAAAIFLLLKGARDLHLHHGVEGEEYRGIQGRYLFVAVPAMFVSAAFGLGRRDGSSGRLPRVLLLAAAVMQLIAWRLQLGMWGGAGASIGEEWAATRAWFAWSPWTIGLWAAILVSLTMWTYRVLGFRPEPPPYVLREVVVERERDPVGV